MARQETKFNIWVNEVMKSPWGTAKNPQGDRDEAGYSHLIHATWECKYHVVFGPKYSENILFAKISVHDLACRKECRIEEEHLMPDHVGMLISIPPKYSVAQIIGYMRGRSSIWIAGDASGRRSPHSRHRAAVAAGLLGDRAFGPRSHAVEWAV
jgi:REP element-mobilizing transposase RayT